MPGTVLFKIYGGSYQNFILGAQMKILSTFKENNTRNNWLRLFSVACIFLVFLYLTKLWFCYLIYYLFKPANITLSKIQTKMPSHLLATRTCASTSRFSTVLFLFRIWYIYILAYFVWALENKLISILSRSSPAPFFFLSLPISTQSRQFFD